MSDYWKGKKVLICGGAGMIGSHMARELLKRGSRGSLKNIRDILPDVDFFKRDLRKALVCDRLTRSKDVVFQYAADMGGIGYITTHFAKLMINNTFINVNMLMAAHVNEVENYFYSSTACVYPNYKQTTPDVVPLKEDDAFPADPNEAYGWEKIYAERLADSFIKDFDMNIHVARFHNVFSGVYTAFDKDKGKAPCHLIMKAIRHPKPPMSVWGDGKATRSFLYVDDCIEAVLRLMETKYNQPINIGSDRLISVDELANMSLRHAGKSTCIIEHDLSKPQGVRGRNADLTLSEQVLKWRPQVSLEDGMKRTYEWAIEHLNELENI
jgi:GDP-D-mannose 3',5'-epimerase